MSAHSIRLLLHGAVDYAGLFPPAALDMKEAVRNYAMYLGDPDSWALGRFIVPVARLREFDQEAGQFVSELSWKVSALGGPNFSLEQKIVEEFNASHAGRLAIDTLEVKATSTDEIRSVASAVAPSIHAFVEIPIGEDPLHLIRAMQETKMRAKVRTGGVTPEAFPRSDHLARFILRCVEAKVPFKATAGLHHPLRAAYNLTYEPGSERGKMYGYVNVLLAAAFAGREMAQEDLVQLLEEESAEAFQFEDTGVTWRSHHLGNDALREAREQVVLSFGSCSFREPIDDLKELSLL